MRSYIQRDEYRSAGSAAAYREILGELSDGDGDPSMMTQKEHGLHYWEMMLHQHQLCKIPETYQCKYEQERQLIHVIKWGQLPSARGSAH